MKRKNALVLFSTVVLAILFLDRITKIIAVDQLTGKPPVVFFPAFLDFALVYNTGGAFGIFEGGAVLFVGVAIIAVALIIGFLIKAEQLDVLVVLALSFISAGALGNAYDRVVSGAVPDFIHTLFIDFPVFNVADMALTMGGIALLLIAAIFWFGPARQKEPPEADTGQDETVDANEKEADTGQDETVDANEKEADTGQDETVDANEKEAD